MKYIHEDNTFKTPEFWFDCVAFGRDLAKEMNATVEAVEEGRYGYFRMIIGKITISFHTARKKNSNWQLRIHSGDASKRTGELHSSRRPEFPSISVNPHRSLASIAADIKRRLLPGATDAVNKIDEKVAEIDSYRANVERAHGIISAAFPELTYRRNSDNMGEAVSNLGNGMYMNGDIDARGLFSFSSLGPVSPNDAIKILAVVMQCMNGGK